MKIDFANLQYQYQLYKSEIDAAIHKVLDQSNYILGQENRDLEEKLKEFTGVENALCCSSGTDALLLALMALDIEPGDEVITTPFTFIATAETIALLKAKPVFVDVDEETLNIDVSKIEQVITKRTRAIMPVSLYGYPCDMSEIQSIATKHDLKVIVDGAQSFGATYHGKTDSALGDISTTSFFPAKPLGCYGDGGAVFTNDAVLAEKMRMMHVHGQNERYRHKYIGIGGRMDTIQSAVVLAKLEHYPREMELRQSVAQSYSELLSDYVHTPQIMSGYSCVWAQYTIRHELRNQIQDRLKDKGIPTAIHYPLPLHLQECFQSLGYVTGDFPVAERASEMVLSLPMNPFLSKEEINYVARSIRVIVTK